MKIFMNICRPLVPKYGLGCPGGTAACLANIDGQTGKPEQEQVSEIYFNLLHGDIFVSK